MSTQQGERGARPLDGIRVLELGQLMAGPMAGTFLGYFGAEVIKVEPPAGGDPVRGWRVLDEGTSLWWRSLGRNKRSITIDLHRAEGRSLVHRLAAGCDVVIENFRPGRMEAWGLGPEDLAAENPALVYTRVSGYGQDGPLAGQRGFASVCEAYAGLRYVTGHPGETPVRSNLSLGDSLAAFQAVIGTVLALLGRERNVAGGSGQVVDVSIMESVLGVMEAAVSEYDRCGVIREPSGTTITGVVPTDAYPCADGRKVVIGANGDSIFQRLMVAAGRPEMAHDERYGSNERRITHQAPIDEAIGGWTRSLPSAEVVRQLNEAGVPAAQIQNARDLLHSEQVRARGHLEEVEVGGRPLQLPAIGPRLGSTPGRTEWPGGPLGADTDAVLGDLLGLSAHEIEDLRSREVI